MDLITESSLLGLLLVFLVGLTTRPAVAGNGGYGRGLHGCLSFLPASDVSLNVISTFAFLLVLGIVVDDAIVVGGIHHPQSTRTGRRTAVVGAASVSRPVIFAV